MFTEVSAHGSLFPLLWACGRKAERTSHSHHNRKEVEKERDREELGTRYVLQRVKILMMSVLS